MHIHKPHCSFYKGLPPTRHICCHLRLTLWLLPIRHLKAATADGPQFGDGPQKNSLYPATSYGHYSKTFVTDSHFSLRYANPDGSVGIATGLRGWSIRTSNHGRGKRVFCSAERPDRLWGPPSLLFKAYRDSSLGGQGVTLPTYHRVGLRLRMSGAIPPLPPCAFMAWTMEKLTSFPYTK